MSDFSNPFYPAQRRSRTTVDDDHDRRRRHRHLHLASPSSSILQPDPVSHPPPLYPQLHATVPFPHAPSILFPFSPSSDSDGRSDEYEPDILALESDSQSDADFDCDFEGEGDDVSFSFVTNLFERSHPDGRNSGLGLGHGEGSRRLDDSEDSNVGSVCDESEGIYETDGELDLELRLGLGVEGENQSSEFQVEDGDDVFRMVRMDSDSDPESFGFEYTLEDEDEDEEDDYIDGDDGSRGLDGRDTPPFHWYDDDGADDVFCDGWDSDADGEVAGVVHEVGHERGIDFSSILGDGVEQESHEREIEIRVPFDTDRDLGDDGFQDLEWDTVFAEAVENLSELTGNPPAAKSVIENLQVVDSVNEGLVGNEMLCAICKDEFSVEDMATKLPCCHCYHGDCIVPWLRIRNTCPVCRYELPTNDPDYEYRKTEWIRENAGELALNSDIRYDFRIFCWWIMTRFRSNAG